MIQANDQTISQGPRDSRQASTATGDSRPLVDAASFGARPDDGSDCTRAVRLALDHCREAGARGLVFPKGRYEFRPNHATEAFVFVSNNDEGLRRIAFALKDFQDFEIDGQGAEFIFHGVMIPFVIENSQRVTLKNLFVDWAKPFHCEGIVLASDEAGVELEIPPPFEYEVLNGHFRCIGASAEGWRLRNMLEFDPIRRETAFGAQDNFGAGDRLRAEGVGPRRVRFSGKFSEPRPTPGNVIMMSDDRRMCPAIFITDSSGIHLDTISIYHAGAMGVIAQRSADLAVDRLKVMPRPGSGRIISITADATHFVSCRGKISLTDCVFENQVDDATNVHGVYTKIDARRDDRTVEVRLVHPQQLGRHPAEVGHLMEFVSNETLLPLHQAEVVAIRRINKEYTELSFAEPLPASIKEGGAVLDLYWQPSETIIRRCSLHGNRARGFLISVGGRVLIEDCDFHVPGAAVLVEGDANYWFEAGPVGDLTIRNNRFINCNYGPWGVGAIQVSPGIKTPFHQEPRYHRSIRIENNRFEVFFPTLIDAEGVDGLTFKNNAVSSPGVYPDKKPGAPAYNIRDCSNVDLGSG